jgi:sugar transferase (PEP-CTERM/EpsH1 system associated)
MRPKLKILHVVHSLQVGGLENGLVNLLNRLDPQRFEQTVCCLTSLGKLAERIKLPNIDIVELNLSAEQFRFPLLRLAKIIRSLEPTIVHTRGWPTVDAVFAAWLARAPHIIHGEHGREHTDSEGMNWKRNQIRRIVGCLVDRYVVVCDFFRPWLRESCRVNSDKIIYIPNGVDTAKFHPIDNFSESIACAAKQELRGRLGLPGDCVLVGSVGRLDPVKDFPTLLRSFKAIASEFREAKLAIVGDGSIRSSLIDLCRELKLDSSVLWLGERSDIAALLRCFDLFVQTSIFEGMSNTILEAMASGLPIIATTTGGNPELVRDNETGLLVPIKNVAALTNALRTYIKDSELRLAHGLSSRETAVRQFDLAVMIERYAALYGSLN